MKLTREVLPAKAQITIDDIEQMRANHAALRQRQRDAGGWIIFWSVIGAAITAELVHAVFG